MCGGLGITIYMAFWQCAFVATAEIVQKYNILSIVRWQDILKILLQTMCRKEKALSPIQRMDMLGRYTNDELYWTTTRCM